MLHGRLGVVAPAVALEDDRAVDDPEVDLVATDAGVELDRREPVRRATSLRMAVSSTLSTGLPSMTHSSSASRKAGTPWRPRRVCTSTAVRRATGDASPLVTT